MWCVLMCEMCAAFLEDYGAVTLTHRNCMQLATVHTAKSGQGLQYVGSHCRPLQWLRQDDTIKNQKTELQ